jgi:hypothetical protein
MDEDLTSIRGRVRTMQLSRALKGVKWELDYLHEPRPAGEQPTIDAADRELFEKVAWLKNPDWPRKVQRQYTQTLAAMNRMRVANSRKRINLRKLRYGGSVNIVW